jgi:ferredoxin-NADP reductase
MKTILSRKNSAPVYSTELLKRSWLTDRVFQIELARPQSFHFIAGQTIRLLHETTERDYSLITAPTKPALGLCVYHVDGGEFSPLLAAAPVGTSLSFAGPHGYFTFRPSGRPVVFIATGTGIAPFLSMVRSGVTDFTLLHGVRTPRDLYYQDEFRSAARRYVPCLTETNGRRQTVKNAFRGRVSLYLTENFPPDAYDFYLCGRQEMIRDVTLVVDERFPHSLVHTEVFF